MIRDGHEGRLFRARCWNNFSMAGCDVYFRLALATGPVLLLSENGEPRTDNRFLFSFQLYPTTE